MASYHTHRHGMSKMRSASGEPSPVEWSLERSSRPDWPKLDLDRYCAKVEAKMNLPSLENRQAGQDCVHRRYEHVVSGSLMDKYYAEWEGVNSRQLLLEIIISCPATICYDCSATQM